MAAQLTVCHHINLLAFLCLKGITCVVLNTVLIANFARLLLRKTKTDKKDALTIQFLLVHRRKLSQVSYSQSSEDQKDLTKERDLMVLDDSWVKEMTCGGCFR